MICHLWLPLLGVPLAYILLPRQRLSDDLLGATTGSTSLDGRAGAGGAGGGGSRPKNDGNDSNSTSDGFEDVGLDGSTDTTPLMESNRPKRTLTNRESTYGSSQC